MQPVTQWLDTKRHDTLATSRVKTILLYNKMSLYLFVSKIVHAKVGKRDIPGQRFDSEI